MDYNGAKDLKAVKVKCHTCSYEWDTISDAIMVTCPSCTLKTRRLKEE